ncbi:hypothetical protein EG68_06865 [Paragonimus skrjabini miyazakii]|uniref:Uncharacterized protein n=1 Tax=Paragonimus skrjabini miyazakii TaxID=59628 RepID=A0A8S9YN85_9TREM|nr:hypothetical protein EG68_06865 [Paragonimus skrjabini miyazakii]
MILRKRDAHLALDQLAEYRNHLDHRIDAPLVSALTRLMNVFQSRLFLALLDIQDFYELTLLDPDKNNDEKTAAALDVAMRWENISSPSLVASTIDLRRSNSSNGLSCSMDRARSLYQLHLMEANDTEKSKPYALQREPQGEFDIGLSHPDRRRPYPDIPLNQSNSTLSFSMLNCTPSMTSPYQWATTMPGRTPDSLVGSNEMGHFNEQTSDSQAQECVSKQKPVAKPRQRRLKRTKSTSATPISPPVNWINTNMLEDRVVEDRTDRSQWGAFRHLPVTTEVIIDRTPQGFGFSIAGGWDDRTGSTEMNTGIYVTRVLPGGAAERDGGLRLGDRILSVNGVSLVGVSHEEAVHALQLAGSRLKLVSFNGPVYLICF